MPQNVKIKIDSKQDDGQEILEVNKKNQGVLYNKAGTFYLKYTEDLEDVTEVKTTLKIKEDNLTLIRRGNLNSVQHFIRGEKTSFDYKTPYGKFSFELEVKEFLVDVSLEQGQIDIVYELYNQEQLVGVNSLTVAYEEA